MPALSAPLRDNPAAGIGYALAAGLVFSCGDALAKLLAPTLPPVEITWLRWCGYVVAVAPAIVATRGRVLRSGEPRLQVFRSACLLGSSLLFIAGLSRLPLATTTTINFVSPLLVTALSIPLLGETVGPRRWAAVLVGLGGVLVVVRPSSGAFGWAALFPILSAACWAAGVITTRRLGRLDGPWTAMSFTALIGFAALSAVVPWTFVAPTLPETAIAAAMAFFTTIGQFLTLAAYTRAPASLIVPFVYVMLIWSTLLGYLLFGTVPDGWTALGAAIIAGSGVYTAHRERIRAREASIRAAAAART